LLDHCHEICRFDFELVYGELGSGFAECHHMIPLSELPYRRHTKLSDFAVVCANCHRLLHRSRPTLDVSSLRSLVAGMSASK
jgi:5-methylcytosine-specific restriction enzyme A